MQEPRPPQDGLHRDGRGRPKPVKEPGHSWPLDYEQEFNVPLVGVLLGVGLLVLGIVSPELDLAPGIVGFVLLGLPSLAALVEQWKDVRFRRWILDHWDEIVEGTAVLDGQTVNPQTTLICYPMVASLLFIHLWAPGRPVLPTGPDGTMARWTSVAIAAVGGWWFFPNGPIATLGALATGIRNTPQQVSLADVATATYQGRRFADVSFDS